MEAVTWERAGLDGTSIRAETHLSYTVTAALKLARLSRRLADDPPGGPPNFALRRPRLGRGARLSHPGRPGTLLPDPRVGCATVWSILTTFGASARRRGGGGPRRVGRGYSRPVRRAKAAAAVRETRPRLA